MESEQTEVITSKHQLNNDEFIELLTYQLLMQQRKILGEPTGDVVDVPNALEFNKTSLNSESSRQALQKTNYLFAAKEDGLVREENENRIVSREDTTELTEVEDVKHFGDFSDAVSLELYTWEKKKT